MDECGENKIYLSSSLFGNHKKPQITLSPVRLQKIKGNHCVPFTLMAVIFEKYHTYVIGLLGKGTITSDGYDDQKKSYSCRRVAWSVSKEQAIESIRSVHYSHAHSKKGIKHALRQQAKRRRKNTKIAAGSSVALPRRFTSSTIECKFKLSPKLPHINRIYAKFYFRSLRISWFSAVGSNTPQVLHDRVLPQMSSVCLKFVSNFGSSSLEISFPLLIKDHNRFQKTLIFFP